MQLYYASHNFDLLMNVMRQYQGTIELTVPVDYTTRWKCAAVRQVSGFPDLPDLKTIVAQKKSPMGLLLWADINSRDSYLICIESA
jgi:hypothetical protein